MSSEHDVWFRLGYALERTRLAQAGGPRKLVPPGRLRPAARAKRGLPAPEAWPPADQLLASGAVALATRILEGWRPRHEVGWKGVAKGGAAGAAAALALEVLRPLLEGRAQLPALDAEAVERILAGAAQGVVYGTVVEPRLPGPPALKGALYGSVEYAVHPAGGLSRVLGPNAPLGRVPVLGQLLEGLSARDRSFLEHLAFGIGLALAYGSIPSSRGTRDDDVE